MSLKQSLRTHWIEQIVNLIPTRFVVKWRWQWCSWLVLRGDLQDSFTEEAIREKSERTVSKILYRKSSHPRCSATKLRAEGGAHVCATVWVFLGLAKTRPLPKPAHQNPTHGLGWVLVSRPVAGCLLANPTQDPNLLH